MSRMFGDYIKLAVDVERGILAGGAESHAECENALLNFNSRQQDIWGAGLNIVTRQIEYDSIINIRPGSLRPKFAAYFVGGVLRIPPTK